jgi:hypothetical protein
MRVCVLGAGIVGLASAYALNRAGHDVTVIDRARPGSGASGGNGAQLSYSYVQPLAEPGIWAQLPKLLLSPSSPLRIRPQFDVYQWRWGLQFLPACNAATSRSTTVTLLQLAAASCSTSAATICGECSALLVIATSGYLTRKNLMACGRIRLTAGCVTWISRAADVGSQHDRVENFNMPQTHLLFQHSYYLT